MVVTWLLGIMAAAVFVSMVLLAVVCLHCRNKGPLVSIRQANASEESSEFRVVHPFPAQQTFSQNSFQTPSNLLSPYLPSADPGTQRRQRSVTPTDTESNPSYENPAEEPDIDPGSDAEDPGYIIVLPDKSQSRASTPSSDIQHDYVNIEIPSEKKMNSFHCPFASSEDKDYLNVEPMSCQGVSTPDLSAQSNSDDDDDDDDDEGNYVNVQDRKQTA